MNERRWLLGADAMRQRRGQQANERERRAELLFCTPTNGHLTQHQMNISSNQMKVTCTEPIE